MPPLCFHHVSAFSYYVPTWAVLLYLRSTALGWSWCWSGTYKSMRWPKCFLFWCECDAYCVCMYLYVEARRQLPCPQLLCTWFLRQILHWSGVHQIGYASCPLSARELPPLPPEHLGYHPMLPFLTQVLGMEFRSSCLRGLGPIGTSKNKVNSNKTNKQKSNPHSNFWVLFILKSKPILLSYWVYPYFFVCVLN